MENCTVGAQIWIGTIVGIVFGFAIGMAVENTRWYIFTHRHIGWTITEDGANPPIDSETSEAR